MDRIRVGQDDTGPGAAWYLDKVIIEDTTDGETYEFPCERWLATNDGDGKIVRDLGVGGVIEEDAGM